MVTHCLGHSIPPTYLTPLTQIHPAAPGLAPCIQVHQERDRTDMHQHTSSVPHKYTLTLQRWASHAAAKRVRSRI
eukprot:1159088-Pelagomonas_calceolata.AAC.1